MLFGDFCGYGLLMIVKGTPGTIYRCEDNKQRITGTKWHLMKYPYIF